MTSNPGPRDAPESLIHHLPSGSVPEKPRLQEQGRSRRSRAGGAANSQAGQFPLIYWGNPVTLCAYGIRIRHRSETLHRLPRLHRRLQSGKRGPSRRFPYLGEVHGEGELSFRSPSLHRPSLQSLRRRALRRDLPGHGLAQAAGCHRGSGSRSVHRLSRLHAGLPLGCALPERGQRHGREVPLLRASDRGRTRAGLRRGLPGTGDRVG